MFTEVATFLTNMAHIPKQSPEYQIFYIDFLSERLMFEYKQDHNIIKIITMAELGRLHYDTLVQ